MLLRLAYLGITNAFALRWLLCRASDREKPACGYAAFRSVPEPSLVNDHRLMAPIDPITYTESQHQIMIQRWGRRS